MNLHGRLDHDVEPHFLEIDVAHMPADRVALVLLEDRGVHLGLTLQNDVEHRVQPRGASQRGAKLTLADGEGVRSRLPVEDAGNEPLLAQATGLGRAEPRTFLHFETKSVAGHGGGL